MSYDFIKNAPFCLDESNFLYRLMRLFQWGLSDAPDEHELRGEPVVVFRFFFSGQWGVPPLQQLCRSFICPRGSSS